MNIFLKKIPVPIAGLALGLAAAGNMVQSYGELYRDVFGIISAILVILLVIKILKYPSDIKDNLKNPIIAGVAPTFSMALMILSTYLIPFAPAISRVIWIVGFIIHIYLIVSFTRKFVLGFAMKQVFSVWFVVYVGLAAASVTGPNQGISILPQIVFWFSLIAYAILLPLVLYRVLKIKELPEPTLPTLAIIAAPASLLLVGYMNAFQTKNVILMGILITLSLSMYGAVLIILPKLLRLKFYPSYSAFTFPFIISGIAGKKINEYVNHGGHGFMGLQYFSTFQVWLGICLVIYVLVRYAGFLFVNEKREPIKNVA